MGTVKVENIDITWEEKNSGKYQSTSILSGGKCQARITKINGEIDPERTYTSQYCRKHNLGRYAKSSKLSDKEIKDDNKRGFFSRLFG